MRAKTCTDLFRQMGVPAARVGYAKLYINGEYRGLFANSEEIDKAFLRNYFTNNDGNLYKCPGGASMQNGAGYAGFGCSCAGSAVQGDRAGRAAARGREESGRVMAVLMEQAGADALIDAGAVSYLPPITDPNKVLCCGLNYRDHAIETGQPIPDSVMP